MSEESINMLTEGIFDDPFSLQLTVDALQNLSSMTGEEGVEVFSSTELLKLAAQVMRDESINPEEGMF